MKKRPIILISAVVIIILVVAGYAILHKSAKTSSANSTAKHVAAAPVDNSVVVTRSNASLGSYLAEPNGDTLYTYKGDAPGVSNVKGSLLASWPAYVDTGSTTGLPAGIGTIKRTDNGEIQYTYNGMPLYTFVGDQPGQVTGNGVANFVVARPTTTSSASSTQSTSTSSSSGSYN
jgi:predicted lipoprotein with Yx(FWY)xxD motif